MASAEKELNGHGKVINSFETNGKTGGDDSNDDPDVQDNAVDNLIDNLLDNEKSYLNEASDKKKHNSLNENGYAPKLKNTILTEEVIEEEKKIEKEAIKEEKKIKEKLSEEERKMEEEKCYKRLNLLLSRSSIYAKFMADKIEQHELKMSSKKQTKKGNRDKDNAQTPTKRKASPESRTVKKQKCGVNMMDVFKKENMSSLTYEENQERGATTKNDDADISRHPSLFYGGKMHQYQVEGYEWLKTLYENGVNGILADEMGLGKTIQTIAVIAYLVEMGVPGPFIVIAPLSTLPNWKSEFERFTPDIPVLFYHGYKHDRPKLLRDINRKVKNEKVTCCPVVITSYQMALTDAKLLCRFDWKMLVIDEAHRIKNFQCQLVRALKTYNAVHRLLLTGTPLQNNLDELWSLLNFILPEIFDDLKVFQSWFDIQRLTQHGASKEIIAKEQEKQIISTIHQILTPFLLRRTKADVSLELPPKKEITVLAPLTSTQQTYYSSVLTRSINKLLQASDIFKGPSKEKRLSRKTEFFGCNEEMYRIPECSFEPENKSNEKEEFAISEDVIGKINLKMQNISMVLRHICNHPYIVFYPSKPVDEDIIKCSGKLLLLDQMLPELKKRGHKVIIFSQFVKMLDILEDYCSFRKYKYCTLYGSMNLDERKEEMETYKDDSVFIFLISTRAGGLGINIISADTVIIYDSDWNPQGDIQAQDRCHRIGQTKPVVVYRYIVPNTVDEKIFDYANAKKKLEKAILRKGRFTSKKLTQSYKALTKEEMLEMLESAENCGFVKTDDTSVLSQEELENILDRSDMK